MNTTNGGRRIFAFFLPLVVLALAALACEFGVGDVQEIDEPEEPAEREEEEEEPVEEEAPEVAPPEEEAQGGQAGGATAVLELVNDSAVDVCYVYISPTTDDTWGSDWLGDTEIVSAGSVRVFEVPAGIYDMRAEDCDQEALDVQNGITIDETAPVSWTFTGGGGFFYDDFAFEDGTAWEVFSVEGYGFGGVVDGEYVLGPFEECADIGGTASAPFACFTQCLACGVVSDYDMSVNVRYLDGLADRPFGMVLRFIDQNSDGLVDPADYYLDFEINVYTLEYAIWEHTTDNQWNLVGEGPSNAVQGSRNSNNLRAISYNGGANIDLYVNGVNVNTVNVPYADGTVGLSVGFRGVQVGFDDFTISGG
jgi:hypothetical protein